MNDYIAYPARYDKADAIYRRCGNSGILLPKISLGFWQNFGAEASYDNCREIARMAFDHGVTHFDLANNYGPPPGSAEEMVGRMLKDDFAPHRDELFISSKAGYEMWPGPYGNWGSRKYLMASLDQSLSRMGLEYVDLFYSHRYDPNTPIEDTLHALVDIVERTVFEKGHPTLAGNLEHGAPCGRHGQDRATASPRGPSQQGHPLGILEYSGYQVSAGEAHGRN
jgi:L-glyceraldehyde 3-phosphate reductase